MRIYIAGSYSRRLELLARAGELEALGHTITSRWLDGHHETRPDIDETGSVGERANWAIEDMSNIEGCNVFVVCNDGPGGGSRGGRHFEAGYAYARMAYRAGYYLFVIGDRANPFYCTLRWRWVPDWQTFLDELSVVTMHEAQFE